MELANALHRGISAQTGNTAATIYLGVLVGVFHKYDGKERPTRYLRGYVVPEAPERNGQPTT